MCGAHACCCPWNGRKTWLTALQEVDIRAVSGASSRPSVQWIFYVHGSQTYVFKQPVTKICCNCLSWTHTDFFLFYLFPEQYSIITICKLCTSCLVSTTSPVRGNRATVSKVLSGTSLSREVDCSHFFMVSSPFIGFISFCLEMPDGVAYFLLGSMVGIWL